MRIETGRLDFVTIDGLLAYGAMLARRQPSQNVLLPQPPSLSIDRAPQVHGAMDHLRRFVERAKTGFDGAEAYRSARKAILQKDCAGDELVFFAAWNRLLAQGELLPLLHAPIGAVLKPINRRPVAIVPRAHLTPQLAEGRIVMDLGDASGRVPLGEPSRSRARHSASGRGRCRARPDGWCGGPAA